MEDEHVKMMSNLRSRRKKSAVGIMCCFTGGRTTHHRRRASFDAASYSSAPVSHHSPRWSPGWFKSKNTLDHTVPEMKGKCRSFISRIGRHRRHSSAELNYDPRSYSLNFAEDVQDDEDSHVMSFSARFSAVSSPRRTPHASDHHSPTLRSPERWRAEAATSPIMEEDHLSGEFESLAENIKPQRRNKRRNKSGLASPSPRAAAGAGEEVNTPVGISSNREILVQMC